ncbi:MAG: hypothetical protein LBE82_03465 [Chitinophagaceae bacterium]|jgi:hypothetical protein|nr:hypothetical protein [Chitinophagaceae bacterium]
MIKFVYKLFFILFAITVAERVAAQSDYILIGDKQQEFLNRLDIKLKNDPVLRFSTVKPFNRKSITEQIEALKDGGQLEGILTTTDDYDLQSLFLANSDWYSGDLSSHYSGKPLFKTLFHNEAHFYENQGQDFSIVVDPVLNFQLGKTNSDNSHQLFFNTRGIRLRANIDDAIGIYTYVSDNQERDPVYVRNFIAQNNALPGKGYYKDYAGHPGANDYFDIRGGITFGAGKNVQFQLAYDNFFIGDGYRSLFLSDFSSPFFFFRATAQINPRWSYTGAIAQTVAPFRVSTYSIGDTARPRNYMMFHHLSFQATDWLQLGLFENSMLNTWGVQKGLLSDSLYKVATANGVGKGLRSMFGLDFKAAIVKNVQAYGQLLINGTQDLFSFGNSGSGNKKAVQIGIKYADAFTLDNLNLQVEYNTVRPYTYSDNWDVNNYAHYNQPLAHPMGANFRELIGVANYRVIKKIYLTGKIFYTRQGLSQNGINYGANIFQPYQYNGTSPISTLDGLKATYLMGSFSAGYELFQNFFLEGNWVARNVKYDNNAQPRNNESYFYIGIRWNFVKRVFEF